VQNVEALETFEPGKGIANRIISDMAHVQVAGWVRKHFEAVKPFAVVVSADLEGARFVPMLLPLIFDLFWKVFFVHSFIQSYT